MPAQVVVEASSGLTAWAGIIGAVAGFVAAIGTEALRAKFGRSQAAAGRAAERVETHRQQQVETLRELQEVTIELLAVWFRVHNHYLYYARMTGTWREESIPRDLTERASQQHLRASVLTARVEDDRARRFASVLLNQWGDYEGALSAEEAIRVHNRIEQLFDEFNDRAGVVLRELPNE